MRTEGRRGKTRRPGHPVNGQRRLNRWNSKTGRVIFSSGVEKSNEGFLMSRGQNSLRGEVPIVGIPLILPPSDKGSSQLGSGLRKEPGGQVRLGD